MPALVLALLTINAVTIVAFWFDKARARYGGRRVRETDLLRLALIGGSPGALVARQLFRHKTRKQPFSDRLMLIAAAQCGAVLGWWIL